MSQQIRNILIIIPVLLFPLILEGQPSDMEKEAKLFIDSLQINESDTFGIYSIYHLALGMELIPLSREDSLRKDTSIYGTYLQWKKHGKYFITRIVSYNTRTEVIPLESSVFFEYFIEHKNSIRKETIKPFTIIEIENGVKKEYTSSVCDNNYIQEFLVIANHDTTYKIIDKDDIDISSAYGKYNFNTKLWKWNVLVEEEIRHLIKQGAFRKRIRYPMYLEILGKKVAF